jgi:cytochrome c553
LGFGSHQDKIFKVTWGIGESMKQMRNILGVFLLLGLLANCKSPEKQETNPKTDSVHPVAMMAVQPVAADLKNGESIYQKGTPAGAAACLSCHRAAGEGQPAAGFPRMAGQSEMYLLNQLQYYKANVRKNPVMNPIASVLTDKEMADVSAYMSQMNPPPFAKAAALGGTRLERGRLLADVGDQKLGLQSCANCHGLAGKGEPPNIPYLAGQGSTYLQAQLRAWRTGERQSSPQHMGYISKLLTEEDIKIVADYFQQVPGSAGEAMPPVKLGSPHWNARK